MAREEATLRFSLESKRTYAIGMSARPSKREILLNVSHVRTLFLSEHQVRCLACACHSWLNIRIQLTSRANQWEAIDVIAHSGIGDNHDVIEARLVSLRTRHILDERDVLALGECLYQSIFASDDTVHIEFVAISKVDDRGDFWSCHNGSFHQ